MSGRPEGGVMLGGPRPRMPEIHVFPFAQVDIHEGGLGVGDATHHMRITLPVQGREICIPYNLRSLNALVHAIDHALKLDNPSSQARKDN